MDIPLLNTTNNVTFANPLPKIIIHLHRGEFAQYISGYYQRKIIEIFENTDKNSNGRLTSDEVNSLDLINSLHATDDSKKLALKEIHGKSHISLSEFIRYASYCIHPKLRDNVFQQIVEKRYGIRPSQPQDSTHTGNGDGDDGDHVEDQQN